MILSFCNDKSDAPDKVHFINVYFYNTHYIFWALSSNCDHINVFTNDSNKQNMVYNYVQK